MSQPGHKNPFSFISNAENQYIQALYEDYTNHPDRIDPSWRKFFEGFEFALQHVPPLLLSQEGIEKAEKGPSTKMPITPSSMADSIADVNFEKESKVYALIEAYRTRGHLLSQINPLEKRVHSKAKLDLEDFGLLPQDLETSFHMGKTLNLGKAPLKDIINHIQSIYCKTLGLEYMHINNQEILQWVQNKFESTAANINFDLEKKKRILKKLNEATVFENFLHTKYIGQKRFSLEGGENTIPAVDAIINKGAELGVQEVVIGMAHRGRLNLLTNIIGKTYEEIFNEFEGHSSKPINGDGDVKYHLGFNSQVKTPEGHEVALKLMPNPSHLEAVGPVVEGHIRARGEIYHKGNFKKILPLLLHGDAAVAAQGVVYELLQMSQLVSHHTGGTIHFVINNQIGFTTEPQDARSSEYCTSVGKTIDVPIIHVNGDDAEAVIYAVEFATEFRQTFAQDIFVDMVCYRKYGHNESDEPKYTQPSLYDKIAEHPNPREVYNKSLVSSGKIHDHLVQTMQKEFKQLLQDRLNQVKERPLPGSEQKLDKEWKLLRKSTPEDFFQSPPTGVPRAALEKVLRALSTLPKGINPIPKAMKLIQGREAACKEGKIDWALAELLSYGSLLLEGHGVRLCGQDAIRGTFSHRHAMIYDQSTNTPFCQLNVIDPYQAKFCVYNSLLSEYAVLGFEYGHSMVGANNLTLWEAQFGDFSNTAQVIIDQFISSAESKWQTMSGLVLLLPHGYEGQGPEHSSARPERYLQLCAEFNMIVINCSTPENFFHALRRQLKYQFRKPLIVLSPKSLLRHPLCVSPIESLITGCFQEILDDTYVRADEVKKVLLCTGKIYYDLLQKQQQEKRKDVAIIRLEQLHPIPFEKVDSILKKYTKAKFIWVQEEPKNMGFWNYILRKLDYYNLGLISRKSSASTASGYMSVHLLEQQELVNEAFSHNSINK